MKKTKWLAVGVLVLLVAGLVNLVFGLIKAPSIPGAFAMKDIDRSAVTPWMEGYEDNPMHHLPEADTSGFLGAIKEFEKSGTASEYMPQLIEAYRMSNRDKYDGNPWYPFFEGIGYLVLEDSQAFETISGRLFSMETVTSDRLGWMGSCLDRYGFHDEAWSYFERSIRQYVPEGNSMDENHTLLSNPFFLPIDSLYGLLDEGKTRAAMQRLNDLVKMNPRIENMYWVYMQTARYYKSEEMETLAVQFEKMAGMQLRDAISFNPWTIAKGDYYLTAMVVTMFMLLVYIGALRFKYHGVVRHDRKYTQADGDEKRWWRRIYLRWHSPYGYLRPGEFLFLLAMAGLALLLSVNAGSAFLSIGRSASSPYNFASGRYDLPESKQALENLKADYGNTPEFKRFYAYCLAKAGDYDPARVLLEQLLDENSDDVTALVNLALIEYRNGDNDRAGRLIERAVELAPSCLEVIHNCRVITGRAVAAPEWLQRLKASDDLETTLEIVCDNFDAVWPNVMAVAMDQSSEPLFMSDRGRFIRNWVEEPLTFRSRLILTLEFAGLLKKEFPVRSFGLRAQKWIWITYYLAVVYFCAVFIRGSGHSEGGGIRRCSGCGRSFRESSTDDTAGDASSANGGASFCSGCAGNARYDDAGFLNGGIRRSRLRWIPFVGAFREGRLVAATIFLTLFLYCLVSFVFANSSVLSVHGTTGYLSSVAVWQETFLPLPISLSMHYAAAYSAILVAGMAVSILLSLAAARPRKFVR